MTPKDFGYAVTVRRVMLDKDRAVVAKDAAISYPYYCELERGLKNATLPVIVGLAAALHFDSLAAFFGWVEDVVNKRP